MLTRIRWPVAHQLSTRHIEDLLQERGISIDHSTVNR
jgi:transposase-like protein